MTDTIIKKNDKFVGMWGYDQTQYSIYNVVDVKGKFVLVEGLNSWSRLDENDLAATSTVKLYKQNRWEELSEEEKADWKSRGFDPHSYERYEREEAIKNAPELTIVKAGRINKDKYSYRWELSNGEFLESTEDWRTRKCVKIIHGVTRRLVQESKWQPGELYIKIDDVITAHLDTDFEQNRKKYHEQNEYTAYNGR